MPIAARSWMAPMCRAVTAGSAVSAAVWLWSESWPGGLGLLQICIELIALAAGGCWAALATIQVVSRWRHRSTRNAAGTSWSFKGTVALVLTGSLWLITVGLVAFDVPLRLRFESSRPAFDRVAAEGEAARGAATPEALAEADRTGRSLAEFETPGRIGRYPAGHVSAYQDSVAVMPSSPAGTFGAYGWFEHFPGGVPRWWSEPGSSSPLQRLSLGGGWYALWFSPFSFD